MNHTLGTTIRLEHANRRTPVALIVDDATPCVNPHWYKRYQLDPRFINKHAPSIPVRFMRQWSDWAKAAGLAGAFTVLPFPAGLGRIDQSLRGFDEAELKEWLAIARDSLQRFDIHPKALSSTLAVQLSDMSVQGVSEHAWLSGQDEQTLAQYLATAMTILRNAGLPSHGTTLPYDDIDADLLARAALAAEEAVNARSVTHAVIEQDENAIFVPCRLLHHSSSTAQAVVGIWVGNKDEIWGTQMFERTESAMDAATLANLYITADGSKGRIVDLLRGNGPVVLRTHYQSLYSNGSMLGLETMKIAVQRLEEHFGQAVEWVSLSTLASRFLVAETAKFGIVSDETSVNVSIDSAYDADVLTFTVVLPWRVEQEPSVSYNGVPLKSVRHSSDLTTNTYLANGSTVTVSVPVSKESPQNLAVASR